MFFAELFSVKSEKSLERHVVPLGRVSCKEISHKPVELCSSRRTFPGQLQKDLQHARGDLSLSDKAIAS